MARTSWFDETTDVPAIHDQVQKLKAFTDAMADGIVDKGELAAQEHRLADAMKALEGELNDDQHARVTKVLVELSAYNIMRLLHELHAERARMAFGG